MRVILALSFGKPDSAGGNKLTAEWAGRISQGEIPIVSDASVPLYDPKLVYRIGPRDLKEHASTLALVREFCELYIREYWEVVIIVCAPDYSDRVVRDLKKTLEEIGYSAIILKAELSGEEKPSDWYRGSKQLWTRSRIIYRIYDFILLHMMPFWCYEKFTG